MFEFGELSVKGYESIVHSTRRINIWHGSIRSGKTVASLIRWVDFVGNGPEGYDYAIVGKTSDTVKTNVIDLLTNMYGEEMIQHNVGTHECWIAGRRCLVRGANDERAEQKLRGATYAGVYADEITTWNESFFVTLLGRMSVPGAKLFGTTNPDSPCHWLKANWLDRERELDMTSFHFRLADNPNLTEQYVREISKEYVGLWRKRFIEGLWVLAEGAIWDMYGDECEFDDKNTEAQEAQALGQHYVAIDYGTTNPFVALEGYVHRNKAWVWREWRYDSRRRGGGQMTDEQYIEALQKWLPLTYPQYRCPKKATYIVDPSATSLIVAFKHKGIRTFGAVNAVTEGISTMSTLFSQRRFMLHRENCRGTIQEIQGYVWDEKAAARGEEKPTKAADHGCDAARYLGMTVLGNVRRPRATVTEV